MTWDTYGLRVKTYQDAIRQAKKLLSTLGIDFFVVYAQEVTYYGKVIASYTEHDIYETDARTGDQIKIQSCLCDMGTIESDIRVSEFFDRYLNFLFVIGDDKPMESIDILQKDIQKLKEASEKEKGELGQRQEPNYNITDNGISFARRIAIINMREVIRSLGKVIRELDTLGDKEADHIAEIAEKLSDLFKKFREPTQICPKCGSDMSTQAKRGSESEPCGECYLKNLLKEN